MQEDTLEEDEGEQERAHHDAGPRRAQPAVKNQRGLNHTKDEQTEQRTEHVTATSAQQRSADHDDGDGIEFQAESKAGIAGAGVEQQNQTRTGRTEAVERIHRDPRRAER